jgi:RimJ/RimL family protein N-acetyltransferase/catechol 2,3-dioxygenase-like lactoylglutathione lyase family enzyme
VRSDLPSLATDRLWLAPLGPDHAADLHGLFGDPEALHYWHEPATASPMETAARVDRMVANSAATWAFGERGSGVALGETGFVNGLEADGHAGFGYSLRRSAWGRGYTAEASRAALDWGFTTVGIARAELWIHRDNVRSRAVAAKLGCSQRAQTLFVQDGEVAVRTVYGVTAAEWRGEPETGAHYGIEPVVTVGDVPAAIAWWVAVLGFRLAFAHGEPPTYARVVPDPGWHGAAGVDLALAGPSGPAAGGSTVGIMVPDADAVAARAEACGATVLQGPTDYPWGRRQVELADPDGNHVRILAMLVRPDAR